MPARRLFQPLNRNPTPPRLHQKRHAPIDQYHLGISTKPRHIAKVPIPDRHALRRRQLIEYRLGDYPGAPVGGLYAMVKGIIAARANALKAG